MGEEELLVIYARHEAALEAGDVPSYREVLAGALRGRLRRRSESLPATEEAEAFAEAIAALAGVPRHRRRAQRGCSSGSGSA